MALGSFYIYDRMNSTYYIEYTENGSVDYKVRYQKNSFFEEEWIGSGQSYVTYLIEEISADFKYVIDMDAENVGFDYSYDVEAQLIVSDKDTGDHLFAPKETLVPAVVRGLDSTDGFAVSDSVSIDFNKYNALAHQFVTVYGLRNATSMLVVSMNVEVISRCDEFESNNENNYVISLNIPLGDDNFSISSSTSVSGEEGSKVLACKGSICSVS